jgi:hypothetical protein
MLIYPEHGKLDAKRLSPSLFIAIGCETNWSQSASHCANACGFLLPQRKGVSAALVFLDFWGIPF